MNNNSYRIPRATVMIVVCVVAIAISIGSLIDRAPEPAASWFALLLTASFACYPLLRAARSHSERDILAPVYLFTASFAILFVIRPIYDLQHGPPPDYLGLNTASGYLLAQIVALLGLIAFYLGYYIRLGDLLAKKLPSPPAKLAAGSATTYFAAVIVFSLAVYALFILRSGGIPVLKAILSGRSLTSRTAVQGSSGYLYTALFWIFPIGIYLLAVSPKWKTTRAALGVGLVILSILPTLGAGNRSTLLPAVFSVGLVYFLRTERRPRLRLLLLVAPLVLLLGVSLPREFRNADYRNQSIGSLTRDLVLSPSDQFNQLFEGLDTAMISALAIQVDAVPSKISYQWGRTLLEALTRPFPRALWPGKPEAGDELLMRTVWPTYYDQQIGFAFSIFGEPYLNFGLVGIFPLFLVYGSIWKACYVWYLRHSQSYIAMSVYAISWPFLFVYMRGGIGVDYQRQVISLLPLLFAWWVLERGPQTETELSYQNTQSPSVSLGKRMPSRNTTR